jgi:peptidoglycan hydrolase-like protein with peptidoglycan-binding domain
MADGKYPLPDVITGSDGVFVAVLSLNQSGDRCISFTDGKVTDTINVTVSAEGSNRFSLTRSVGAGGINLLGEVRSVQQRLKDLGYAIGDVDGIVGSKTIDQIKLFQSIIQGRSSIAGDGRVDPNGSTHQWLQAENAPRWMVMPPTNLAIGYCNRELEETWDNHDYGTDWLANAILAIAKHYQTTYRAKYPKKSPFTINDVSIPHGGNTPDHAGHDTCLDCLTLIFLLDIFCCQWSGDHRIFYPQLSRISISPTLSPPDIP